MSVTRKLKIKAKISKYIGLTSMCYYLNRKRKRIIAYHNIIEDNLFDGKIHLDYSTKESSFRKQIEVIKKRFNVDLDIENKSSLQITFDDGYLNQFNLGSKILDEYNLKGYIFLAGDLVNSEEALAIDKIMYWFSYVPLGEYNLKDFNLKLVISNEEKRREEFYRAESLVNKDKSLDDLVKSLDEAYKFNEIFYIKGYKERFCGPSKEIMDEFKRRGHKIGAHSKSHHKLSNLKDDVLKTDIEYCKKLKGTVYNTDVFCYPYGSKKEVPLEVINLVKENEFKAALAYSNEPMKEDYERYFMPRMILPDTDDEDVINFILSGAINLIMYKKLLPIWKECSYES